MVESGVGIGAPPGGEAASTSSTAHLNRTRLLVGLLLTAGLLGLATLLGFGLSRGDGTGATNDSVGRVAPDFNLPSLDGGTVSLSQFRGRPVFVYFWASWCVPCREEAPGIEATWRDYRGRGVAFLGVNMQDSDDAARAFVREFNTTFPTLRDRDGSVYIDYGVYGVPEAFFVDARGTIAQRWIGPLTAEDLRTALDRLVTG